MLDIRLCSFYERDKSGVEEVFLDSHRDAPKMKTGLVPL
jgi:hypothetical protein